MLKHLSLCFILLFTGCALKPLNSPYAKVDQNLTFDNSKTALLGEAFVEYWHYRSSRLYNKSYAFELPYYRYLHSLEEYTQYNNAANADFMITMNKIELIQDNIAKITYLYQKNDYTQTLQDKWIFVDGRWYHKFMLSFTPPSEFTPF